MIVSVIRLENSLIRRPAFFFGGAAAGFARSRAANAWSGLCRGRLRASAPAEAERRDSAHFCLGTIIAFRLASRVLHASGGLRRGAGLRRFFRKTSISGACECVPRPAPRAAACLFVRFGLRPAHCRPKVDGYVENIRRQPPARAACVCWYVGFPARLVPPAGYSNVTLSQ